MPDISRTDPITQWIMTTMVPGIAAYALILTPGARFSVAPENLIGKDFEFIELRGLVEQWGKHHFMLSQFEARPRDSFSYAELSVWTEEIKEWSALTGVIDEKIAELGA